MPEILPPDLPFFLKLLILLLLARVFGEIMEYFGQPALIGEIFAGILAGPTVFNIIHQNNELKTFGELGIFLLVVRAGLEIRFDDVKSSFFGKNFWIAMMGFFVPITLGVIVGIAFNLDIMVTTFMALCIAITALPVSIRILMDLKKLNTPIGKQIISVAIFNDVMALMILGILLHFKPEAATVVTSAIPEVEATTLNEILLQIGEQLGKVLLFFAIILLVNKILYTTATRVDFVQTRLNKVLTYLKGRESLFAIVFVFILIFASLSELVGLHFVVGAFFGAMLLNEEMLGKENFKKVEDSTSNITIGFLAPIFFAGIGLEFSISSIDNYWLLFIVLAVSFFSKIFGGFVGARLAGMNNRESLTIGIGLNARGIIELVIANIALKEGIIDYSMFSILVIMGVTTTIATPYLLGRAFKYAEAVK
jgi:Kef-type K+ transport system membrane component KefB